MKFKCLNEYQIDFDIVKSPRARRWVRVIEGQSIDLSKIIDNGFKALPKRWIVERTFAWINRYRRLSKEYEYLPATSESWTYLSMIRLMLKRIAATF
ncbi:Transposase, IS5 family, OrfB [Chlamydiales bacterium STE3]|nr:Transposase, IS5 family, OrfB [Chlamydiales bacterium STE3]